MSPVEIPTIGRRDHPSDAEVVRSVRAAAIGAGFYRDPYPEFARLHPGWDRARWDRAMGGGSAMAPDPARSTSTQRDGADPIYIGGTLARELRGSSSSREGSPGSPLEATIPRMIGYTT